MKWIISLSLAFIVFISGCTKAHSQSRGDVRIMFYNLQNLFDTEDDPNTEDEDFTPTGKYHWTPTKYKQKLANTYKVIAGVGGTCPPEIIGFCELENRKVLNDLIYQTPLSKFRYEIVHFDSPDPRGIDVALLYRSDKSKLLKQQPIFVKFKDNPKRTTRNILFAKLLLDNKDTLCVFVNHWPSRRGGELESEGSRIQVASLLRGKVDSLFKLNPRTKIVIMGDFNDEPTNTSITKYLKAGSNFSTTSTNQLFNLTGNLKNSNIGSYNFRGHWQILDQLIVSGELLSGKSGLITNTSNVHIYNADYLLQPDKKNIGTKPLPTYSGFKYTGGFSDHLPVYFDLFTRK